MQNLKTGVEIMWGFVDFVLLMEERSDAAYFLLGFWYDFSLYWLGNKKFLILKFKIFSYCNKNVSMLKTYTI